MKRHTKVGKSFDEDFPLPKQEEKILYGYMVYMNDKNVIQFHTIGTVDLPKLLGLNKIMTDKLQDISNKNRGRAKGKKKA